MAQTELGLRKSQEGAGHINHKKECVPQALGSLLGPNKPHFKKPDRVANTYNPTAIRQRKVDPQDSPISLLSLLGEHQVSEADFKKRGRQCLRNHVLWPVHTYVYTHIHTERRTHVHAHTHMHT